MNHGIDYRWGHGHDTLEQERTDDNVGNGRLVDRSAADQDSGNRGKGHIERRHVQLDKAEALLIHQDADGGQPGGHNHREHSRLVDVDTGSPGEVGVGTHRGHGRTGFGVEKRPHQEGQHREEQKAAHRNGEISNLNMQEVGQDLIVKALQGDGGTKSLARQSPNHGRTVVGQQKPHHTHEGNR